MHNMGWNALKSARWIWENIIRLDAWDPNAWSWPRLSDPWWFYFKYAAYAPGGKKHPSWSTLSAAKPQGCLCIAQRRSTISSNVNQSYLVSHSLDIFFFWKYPTININQRRHPPFHTVHHKSYVQSNNTKEVVGYPYFDASLLRLQSVSASFPRIWASNSTCFPQVSFWNVPFLRTIKLQVTRRGWHYLCMGGAAEVPGQLGRPILETCLPTISSFCYHLCVHLSLAVAILALWDILYLWRPIWSYLRLPFFLWHLRPCWSSSNETIASCSRGLTRDEISSVAHDIGVW